MGLENLLYCRLGRVGVLLKQRHLELLVTLVVHEELLLPLRDLRGIPGDDLQLLLLPPL